MTETLIAAASENDATERVESKDGICGICPAGCFVTAHLEDGVIDRVEPRANHPLGMICTIGAHSADVIYDPDRITYPMRRVGEKGSLEFERISWDEAMATVAAKLQEIKATHGPEATSIYTGRGSFELSLCDIFQPAGVAVSSASSVLFPFGSPNTMGVGALCYVSFAMIAPHVTFGEMYITLETDLEQCELAVIWGANPATDSPPLLHQRVMDAKARGARVVSIDPRRNQTARAAEAEWVAPRPGTDGALALAMIQVLIEEELYDEDFVDHWTTGFEELAQYTQHFRPEVVADVTGVDADTIRALARAIADARGAAPIMYSGLEYSDSGVQAIRAVFTLWALAGQLDVPGGLCIRMRENQFPINRSGLIANPDTRKALARDQFPVYSQYRGESHAVALPESVLHGKPYRIRSLIILGGSMITAWPNPELWKETLGALDFLVCVDRYLTADAAYADIVLPATTMYEIDSYMVYGPRFSLREKMIDPVGEARDDFHILAELAARLGYGERYPQDDDARIRHVLEGSGFTLEDVRAAGGTVSVEPVMMQYRKWEKGGLRSDGQKGFETPSGKFEIASSILEEHGYDPLPVYTEPGEGPLAQPALAGEYPLVFNSGSRIFADFRSQHHGVSRLRDLAPDPTVMINTRDAAARTIESDDWVWVVTPRGKVRFRAIVTDDIVEGAIDASMGGGGPLGADSWKDCNVNELTDLERLDPISGFPVYKSLLCELVKDDASGKSTTKIAERREETAPKAAAAKVGGRKVYLDHNATTPLHRDVLEAMMPYLTEQGGNPSSIHSYGSESRSAVEGARRKLAALLNTSARRIVFTGGGSEADNLAIKGAALADSRERKHLVISAIEHPAVIGACEGLAQQGFRTSVVPVGRDGRVDPVRLEKELTDDTCLVSVMLANNELGTLQPIADIASICRDRGILCHTDAVQAVGKIPVDVDALGVDLLALSAHKLYGPKGMGALYTRKGVPLSPLIQGGGQESGIRAGTENVAGIVGFGAAAELAQKRLNEGAPAAIGELRDTLEAELRRLVPDARVNGDETHRTPNTTNLILPGMRGESLVLSLDRKGVFFSSGSACKSGNPDPSHVLKAIGLADDDAHCSIRLSLGGDTTHADIEYVVEAFAEAIEESRTAIQFVGCR